MYYRLTIHIHVIQAYNTCVHVLQAYNTCTCTDLQYMYRLTLAPQTMNITHKKDSNDTGLVTYQLHTGIQRLILPMDPLNGYSRL